MEESVLVTIDRLLFAANKVEGQLDNIAKMTAEEAAAAYVEFRDRYDALDAAMDKWVKLKGKLSKEILPRIFEDSMHDNTVTLKSGHRVTISYKTLASIKDKVAGFEWLRNNGLGDLITETVNASTLAATAKKMQEEENRTLPEEYFNVVLQPNTSITKKK